VIKILAICCLFLSSVHAASIVLTGTNGVFLTATVDGQANQLVICDDFYHTSYVPSGPLTYNTSLLTGPNALQYARFQVFAVQRYQMAAFLLDGLSQAGPGSTMDLSTEYQYALWHLFAPSVELPNRTALTLLSNAWESVEAGGLAADLLYSRLRIYTPTYTYRSNQEFLQLLQAPDPRPWDPPVHAPEPSSAMLMAAGATMISVSYALRRRASGWFRRR
jgi:hypothetical protein